MFRLFVVLMMLLLEAFDVVITSVVVDVIVTSITCNKYCYCYSWCEYYSFWLCAHGVDDVIILGVDVIVTRGANIVVTGLVSYSWCG